ncbi:hypothetical protein AA313_de0200460 [Arthrobotrys entomopaga]|nr:hypothetical protein AA313_de0200460 [Arthrobotrys entomopaga]
MSKIVPVPPPRKSLERCFQQARLKFHTELLPATEKDPGLKSALEEFLRGTNINKLTNTCKGLSDTLEEKANSAYRLWHTLDQLKSVGDVFMDFAPESVSMVWFGISALITVGNARVQTKLLICGTCDSIANIIGDCVRWEARMAQATAEMPKFEIWESDMPDLIYNILDFLWRARPHMTQNRIKRIGTSLKDLFTQELQAKVDAIVEKYEKITKLAQAHFEESVFHESLNYVSIGNDVVDALQKQALLYELDRQQTKITSSHSQTLHFTSLNDRLTRIIQDRNGSPPATWLFSEPDYIDWKGTSNNSSLLCIRGPRGHGKSVAMMSAGRELLFSSTLDTKPLICRFFFKKGEQDIQHSRAGLESILYQLLDSNELRSDIPALVAAVQALNPAFADKDSDAAQGKPTNFWDSHASLCETIAKVAEGIPQRVYIMVDALDECQDRRENNLTQNLASIAEKKSDGVKLVISARDSIDIESEMGTPLPEYIKFVEITSAKNSSDLETYLKHDIGIILQRRINQNLFPTEFNTELLRIAQIVHAKAKGDFTLARMIIASLKQPSKDSLEKKIARLPAAIGDIYMANLESLTPDEQELMVSALKRVVWSVSGVNVMEISDHYREVYKEYLDTPLLTSSLEKEGDSRRYKSELNATDDEFEPTEESVNPLSLTKFVQENPLEDPEIRDMIFHLENAGRDFFKVDRNTGLVNVDISVREWIQESNQESSSTVESRGFSKTRDPKGHTNSMPRRYEIERWPDHIRILQNWWDPTKLTESWWSELLTQLAIFARPENCCRLSLQRNQEEFDHCELRDGFWGRGRDRGSEDEYLTRIFDEPLHIACRLGLHLMVDNIVFQNAKKGGAHENYKPRAQELLNLEYHRKQNFKSAHDANFDPAATDRFLTLLVRLGSEGVQFFLDAIVQKSLDRPTCNMILAIPDPFRTAWFADIKANGGGYDDEDLQTYLRKATNHTRPQKFLMEMQVHVDKLKYQFSSPTPAATHQDEQSTPRIFNKPIEEFLQQCGGDKALVSERKRELQDAQFGRHLLPENICDIPDINGRLPLFLASPYPDTVRCLIKHGADINKKSRIFLARRIFQLYDRVITVPESPLVSILSELAARPIDAEVYENISQQMLQSAQILILEGADLSAKGTNDRTLLHLAARIRDLKLFKLLCLSDDWDVTVRDGYENTPLHHLFFHPRPKKPEKQKEILEICRMMMKMRRSVQDDLVNAQDKDSRNPLSWAVSGGFTEAIELLLDLGADVHDDNSEGMNCFHLLAERRNGEEDEARDLKIANMLFKAGVDITKRTTSLKTREEATDDSRLREDGLGTDWRTRDPHVTPLELAVIDSNWHMADFILDKYAAIGKANPDNHPLMIQNSEGQTILLTSFLGRQKKSDNEKSIRFARRVLDILADQPGILGKLIRTVDGNHRSPIWNAINQQNLDMVKVLVDVDPSIIDTYNLYHQGPLERAAYYLKRAAVQIRSGIAVRVETLKDILEYLILHTPPKSLFYLETTTFARGKGEDGSSSDKLDMKKIISHYDGFRDEHGWTVHDLLKVLGREYLIPDEIQKQETLSPPEHFVRPSRIGCAHLHKNIEGSLSEDGLQYSIRASKFAPQPRY